MTVYRSIRIQMPDRPGALSSISAALAAHMVDIVRLDVVSHADGLVVDDLLLGAGSEERISDSVASFRPEVSVQTFEQSFDDPVLEFTRAISRAAAGASAREVRLTAVESARLLGRAELAAFVRIHPDGLATVLAGPGGYPAVLPYDPFLGRWAVERRLALACAGGETWASPLFVQALGDPAWVALAPCGPHDIVIIGRRQAIPYYPGELQRLAAFGRAIGGILALHGDRIAMPPPGSWSADEPPASVLTMATVNAPLY